MGLIVGWVWMVRVEEWNPIGEGLSVGEDSLDRCVFIIICDRPTRSLP